MLCAPHGIDVFRYQEVRGFLPISLLLSSFLPIAFSTLPEKPMLSWIIYSYVLIISTNVPTHNFIALYPFIAHFSGRLFNKLRKSRFLSQTELLRSHFSVRKRGCVIPVSQTSVLQNHSGRKSTARVTPGPL